LVEVLLEAQEQVITLEVFLEVFLEEAQPGLEALVEPPAIILVAF
jgi:hypothetical protein